MKLWHLRWTALLKLSKFDIIETEISNLKALDLKEMCFDDYQEFFPARLGTMISFDVLLIICKLPSFKGNHNESIYRLFKLLTPENYWDFKPSREQHFRIILNIVNIVVKIPDLIRAIELAQIVSNEFPGNLDILALVGRLELQVGNINAAHNTFSKVLICPINLI